SGCPRTPPDCPGHPRSPDEADLAFTRPPRRSQPATATQARHRHAAPHHAAPYGTTNDTSPAMVPDALSTCRHQFAMRLPPDTKRGKKPAKRFGCTTTFVDHLNPDCPGNREATLSWPAVLS